MSAYTITETATAEGGSVVLSNGGAISTTLAAASGTGSYTLDLPTAPGSATALFKTNGTTAATFKVAKPAMWIVRDSRPSNQGGGIVFTSSWTRTTFLSQLVTTPQNNGEVSLNNQRFSISEGTYYILVSLPIADRGAASTYQGRLSNVTLGTFTYGTMGFVDSGSTCPIFIPEIVTVPAGLTYAFEIQARASGGTDVNWGEPISGTGTVMELVKIQKLSP